MLSLADWSRFLEAIPGPAALVDDAGIVKTANPALAALLDSTTERLAGQALIRLAQESARSALAAAMAAREPGELDIRIASTRPAATLQLSVGPMLDDHCRVVLARALRVEEHSEQQLLEYFRDAIDTVGSMVAILDADDRMIAYNREYREGYRVNDRDLPPEVDLVGRTYRECMELRAKYKLHREFLDEPSKFIEERMRQHSQDSDQRITLANGQTLKVEKRLLRRGARVIIGTDITDIVEGERKRHDLEAQLRHSQKLEALGTLTGGITHDLNNTLVPIVALSKSIARRLPEGSRDRASLELVVQAADRARDLVDRILAFSRKEQVQYQLMDLRQVVDQGTKLLRSLVPTTIDILSELAPVPPIMGDAGQCYQVLVNLVSNASRAIGTGPGSITVRLEYDTGSKRVLLEVRDTGCGMDEATKRRIFEPFYTTRKVGEGTGLGLSVVHGIIISHGGTVEVKSAPGEGTTFAIRFPRAPEAATRETPAA